MAQLTREKGSKGLVANFATGTGEEVVLNDFDSKYPFSKISEIVDDNGDAWISIPRYYRAITVNSQNIVTGRELSEYKVADNWLASPIFTNNAGHDVSSIEVSKYHVSVNNGELRSVPGVEPARNLAAATLQSYLDKLNSRDDGYEYLLYNIWVMQMEQDLFTVEFANNNSEEVIKGVHPENKYSMLPTGATDVIKYHTGMTGVNGGAMKYRGMENIYGNGSTFVDGITITGSEVTVDINGEKRVGKLPAVLQYGYIKQMQYDLSIDVALPATTLSSKTGAGYGDYYSIDATDKDTRMLRKHYQHGLFGYIFSDRTDDLTTYKIVRRIKK